MCHIRHNKTSEQQGEVLMSEIRRAQEQKIRCNTFYVTLPSAHVLRLMSLTAIWARSEDIVSLREDRSDKDNGLEKKV